jgi:hypothetical protein
MKINKKIKKNKLLIDQYKCLKNIYLERKEDHLGLN